MLPKRSKRIRVCAQTIDALVQSVINSKRIVNMEEMDGYLDKSYPANAISDCAERYGLEISATAPFIAWPVFMGTKEEGINICAVNFGALTLYEKNNSAGYSPRKCEYINAAMNVLVITNLQKERDGKTVRYWPTSIDYSDRTERGTINQASLSLTSLFKFGFLDKVSMTNNAPLDPIHRANRFRFVIENLNWILSLQNEAGARGAAWSYAEDCREAENDQSITNAIIPSQFCYELVARMHEYFTSAEENRRLVNEIDPSLLNRLRKSCEAYEVWITNAQHEDGGYSRNNNTATSSFAHSCCAMLAYVYDNEADSSRLNRLMSYLIKNHKNFRLSLYDVIDNYKFKYEVGGQQGYVADLYEVFPETLFLINCCKNIDNGTPALEHWRYKRAMRRINYLAYNNLFARLKTVQIQETLNNTVVEGRQELGAKRFPIYALYYTKICLQRLKNNDELPPQERKNYIATPLPINMKAVGLFLLLAVCLGFACYISAADTLLTIILSVVTFAAPLLFQIFVKKDR